MTPQINKKEIQLDRILSKRLQQTFRNLYIWSIRWDKVPNLFSQEGKTN